MRLRRSPRYSGQCGGLVDPLVVAARWRVSCSSSSPRGFLLAASARRAHAQSLCSEHPTDPAFPATASAAMPIQSDVNNLNAPFPVVDADPHFSRVLRNLRTQDYLLWGGATAFAPGALYGMGASSISSPCRRRAHELTSLLVLPPRRARRPDQDGPCPHALVVEARDLARLRWRLPPRVPERVACVASSSSPLPPPSESAADLLLLPPSLPSLSLHVLALYLPLPQSACGAGRRTLPSRRRTRPS